MSRFVGIVSGKGGVGKTTTAINLGMVLTNFGRDVVIVDANLKTPNVGLQLGISRMPITLHDAVRGNAHIADAAYKHISGLRIIPASISFEDSKTKAHKSLSDTMLDLHGKVDIALLDIAAGLNDEVTDAMKACDNLLVVVTPDMPSVTDALKTIKLAEEIGVRVFGVIVNKSGDDELTTQNIETILEKPVIGVVPYDDNVGKSLKCKFPVVYSHPESAASYSYKKLAATLLGEEFRETLQKESVLSRLMKKFK